MPFQTDWVARQHLLDGHIDATWGEPVQLHPWTKGSISTPGGPDSRRQVLFTIGVYERPGATITGEGGTQGAMLSTQIVESDIWLSITQDKIGSPPIYGKGDRVYWSMRDEWFEISYIHPSATNRPDLHLIRLQPSSVIELEMATDLSVNRPRLGAPLLTDLGLALWAARITDAPPLIDTPSPVFYAEMLSFIDSSPILDAPMLSGVNALFAATWDDTAPSVATFAPPRLNVALGAANLAVAPPIGV